MWKELQARQLSAKASVSTFLISYPTSARLDSQDVSCYDRAGALHPLAHDGVGPLAYNHIADGSIHLNGL